TQPVSEVRESDPAPPERQQSSGGVMVAPVDGVVEVALLNTAAGTRVRVIVHAGSDVIVDSFASTPLRFVPRAGHVAVDLGGNPTTLRVSLPDDLRLARILAGGEEVAAIEAGRLVHARSDLGITIDAVMPGR
ncbi:MAG: hypothetical protein ACRELX_11035, partial [Longimicrobiales bacterium]